MNSAYTKDITASALVLAGGSGARARAPDDSAAKQFMALGGKPLLAWSLESLSQHPAIETLILVLPAYEAQNASIWEAHVASDTKLIFASGGDTRRASTLNGLEALKAYRTDLKQGPVLVHDGARPFLKQALIDRLLLALHNSPGASPTLPVTDTLKNSAGGTLTTGPDRSVLASVQTPQAFDGELLLAAHRAVETARPDVEFTDDVSIMEWAGHRSVPVAGDSDNIKITTPEDWARAKGILAMNSSLEPRTGVGYDVHRLVRGHGVWLCGHFIPHTHKLDGHSDADVGLHAITDALLGAIGAGDIGTHFPPSDPQWKGAESHIFLAHAASLIRKRGGKIINVDVAIVAENPKIGPHREAMTARMAEILEISLTRVSVKATTNERMGFAGREEGIGALATATVMVPADD